MMIRLQNLTKNYVTPAGVYPVLRGIDLDIGAGEFVAIAGRSGSGKSTLLNLIAGLDRPSSGSVTVGGAEVHRMAENRLAKWRGAALGFVFQSFQLIPTLTAAENVMLAMDFNGSRPARERRGHAISLLQRVGVAGHAHKMPATLSGGEQQRVAIARALANDPPLILADEPTGNLDSHTGAAIFCLFGELAAAGKTIVVVTHDRTGQELFDRIIELGDGRVISDREGHSCRQA